MFTALAVFIAGLFVGLVYGKLAAIYHWHLPPNWIARLAGADGETAWDLAFVSLWIDTALLALLIWMIWRLYLLRRATGTWP
jgi:hypothetical protein